MAGLKADVNAAGRGTNFKTFSGRSCTELSICVLQMALVDSVHTLSAMAQVAQRVRGNGQVCAGVQSICCSCVHLAQAWQLQAMKSHDDIISAHTVEPS